MKNLSAHIALFVVALIYGTNYTIAKEVLDGGYVEPLGFILLRVVTAVVLFWLVHALFVKEKIERKDLIQLALCGLFGVAINQMFFFSGLKFTTPINASLIMTTSPILVLIISSIIVGERFTKMKVTGILFGMAGAALLISKGHTIVYRQQQVVGDILVFINAASYGIYLVLVGRLMAKYHPVTVVKWVFTFGAIYVLPFGFNELKSVEWSTFSAGIWLSVVYVLLFTTFLAYLLNAYALRDVSATVASAYVYLQPILAGLISLAFGKETFYIWKGIAAALIFTGVYLVSKKSNSTAQMYADHAPQE